MQYLFQKGNIYVLEIIKIVFPNKASVFLDQTSALFFSTQFQLFQTHTFRSHSLTSYKWFIGSKFVYSIHRIHVSLQSDCIDFANKDLIFIRSFNHTFKWRLLQLHSLISALSMMYFWVSGVKILVRASLIIFIMLFRTKEFILTRTMRESEKGKELVMSSSDPLKTPNSTLLFSPRVMPLHRGAWMNLLR